MATESTTNEFGRVSRIKGRLFEILTFSASVTGIVALAALLIYVSIDAFDLEAASPEWLLVYFITLVIPYIGFCLYGTDYSVKRVTGIALVGGLVGTALLFTAIETFIRSIPRLNWQLAYLFVVVLPITGYVSVASTSTRTGAIGFGLLGRLAGGAALGLWTFLMFIVFDLQMWFLVYTLSIVPAGLAVYVLNRWAFVSWLLARAHRLRLAIQTPAQTVLSGPRQIAAAVSSAAGRISSTVSRLIPSPLLNAVPVGTRTAPKRTAQAITATPRILGLYAYGMLTTPVLLRRILVGLVGMGGILAAYSLRAIIPVYPSELIVLAWSLVIPGAGLVTALTARQYNRRRGFITGGIVLTVALGGGIGLSTMDFSATGSVLLLLGIAVPTTTYLYRVGTSESGRAGLVLPVLLVGGALVGALLVETLGIAGPNAWLDLSYVSGAPTTQTTKARSAGLFPPIVGSVLIITLVAILSFVLGVGTAVFLEEYTSNSGLTGSLSRLIQINIANLAAVPSVVYGLLGLAVFVNLFGFGFGTAVSASLTLSLLILPITVISAQEAIRSVPNELRDGSLAMGATRWQTTKNVVLPEAMPGILTGIILALGRAIGETAPLIMIGMANIAFSPPADVWSRLSAMPMMIFQWAANPSADFRFGVVAAGVLTLLAVLLTMNATAIIIRNKYERGT